MKKLIKNVTLVLDGEQTFPGGVLFEDGKILAILKERDALKGYKNLEVIDGEGNYLLPGLIDTHLHGSYGYDFIKDPQISINEVSKGLPSEGTTSFMASLTVVSHEDTCQLLQGYSQCTIPENGANFLGVHSEGPYLSKEYKALMDETYLRDPSLKELEEMKQAGNGILKIMTIAPERKGMDEFIPVAIQSGITLMIGHTACSCDEALNALDKDVTGFTHLYNAMSQHLHRAPGAVTAALYHDNALAEMIVDGFHTHPNIVKSTWKMLGAKRIVLITDAMLGKGMPDGDYIFSNLDCKKTGNTVQVKETGRIAGSAITMLDAIKNMKKYCNCTLNELVQMACVNPAKVAKISKQKGTLAAGKDADMILLDQNLNLVATYIAGKQCWHK